jgi:hypothetical protein
MSAHEISIEGELINTFKANFVIFGIERYQKDKIIVIGSAPQLHIIDEKSTILFTIKLPRGDGDESYYMQKL